uniref:Uncharacterized protein n=1 Tax=Ceratitis capitata TaxID=7213 RepID=W8BYQ1_CERCA
MEESVRDSNGNVCLDQIERIMQELDSTTTVSQSSTYFEQPPATELVHRPIVLPAEIKKEPVDKANDSSHTTVTVLSPHEDVSNAMNSTVLFESTSNNIEMRSTIAAESAANVIAAQILEVSPTPQILIKQERIETDIVTPPKTVPKDSSTSSIPKRSNEDEIQTPTVVNRIKTEPLEAEANATQMNMPASTISVVINQECVDSSESTTTPSAIVPRSSPDIENKGHEHDETLPDNFFDDLIRDADNITAAALQANAPGRASLEKQTNEVVLNIKSEPSEKCSDGDKDVEAFNVKREPLETDTVPEVAPSAPIPENFFDDLLVDHVAEHIEDVVNHDLEIKYSKRLKELQQLETVEHRSNKAHKKHKKKKKKSRKRSLDETIEEGEVVDNIKKRRKRSSSSHSPTIPSRIAVKNEFSLSPAAMEIINLDSEPETSTSAANRALLQKRIPSIRIKPEFATFPQPADEPDICLPVRENELFQRRSNFDRNGLIMDLTSPLGFKRIKLEKDVDRTAANHTEFISPKDKMQNAKQRAIAAIDELNKMSKKTTLSAFVHTTTVRKLPNSCSYINQQIYDNRSPLHNVNNVQYKFNSHASRFNLHEWGLEQMSTQAAKVAKVLGFDAHTLMKKLQTVKMPPKLLKIKKEHMEREYRMKEPQSSYLLTVATQTDEVTVLDATSKHQKSGFDIGVQTITQANNIGTQTIDLPAAGGNSYQDLPLVQKLGSLNENQLLALSEFADIMREPPLPKDASSIDLYRQHQRIIDLYKWSQRPSALESTTHTTTQPIRAITASSVRSNEQILRDPRQERIVRVAQTAVRPSVQNPRDPRQERRIPESPPPPPPPSTRQLHAVQSSHLHFPNSNLPQANAKADSVPQKIPVISSVQSFHPASLLPPPPRDARQELGSKYFGRGSIRR